MDLSGKYVQDCYLVVHTMAVIRGTVAELCEVDDIMKTSLVPRRSTKMGTRLNENSIVSPGLSVSPPVSYTASLGRS